MVAGVCAGLGQYTGIDPVIFRVAFALLTVAGGLGVMLYIAAVLLMPANPDPWRLSVVENALRRRFDGEAVLAILGALLVLGVLTGMTGGPSRGSLIAITVMALALLVAHNRDVNLGAAARRLPEQLRGHPVGPFAPPPPAGSAGSSAPPNTDGMVDLATLGTHQQEAPPYPAPPAPVHPAPPAPVHPTQPAPVHPTQPAPPPPRTPRPRSILTPVTLLLAMMAGAAVLPTVAGRATNSVVQITLAAALAVVGLGLVVGSVFGRGRGLVAFGTLLSLGLLFTSLVAFAPPNGRFGDVAWRPVDATGSEQTYRLTAGDGRLDLTALPLRPGQRIRVNAELDLGELRVTVPRDSRVEAHLTTRVGDVTVDKRVVSGPNATLNEVLEPEERTKNPPTIELHVRGKLGDVEVTRG
jgi:phage shock protein PspC (stress-responsive transcriptional regulator)